MNEPAARDAVLVRAIEAADAAREICSDADRLWASRAAAEAVGESAPDDAFLAARASLAVRRLATRYPKLNALTRPLVPQRLLAVLAAPLWRQRATGLLQVCAAARAAGAIGGL